MKLILPIAAFAAVLALATSTVSAQTPSATGTTTAATTKAKATRYSGVLSAVDPAGTSISITDKTVAPRTFAVTAATKIKVNSKTAKVTDLKVGDKVSGSYTTDASGALTATTINDGATTTAKKATKTAAAATGTTTTATH